MVFQEREAEKIAEEAAALRDVKTELPAARSPDSWHGSAYYRHLNVLKGEQETRWELAFRRESTSGRAPRRVVERRASRAAQ